MWTGDGKIETVFMDSGHLYVYRYESGVFQALAEYESDRTGKNLYVDAADIDGNGRAEIYVTSVRTPTDTLDSFVLEYNDGTLARIYENQRWYFRVLCKSGEKKPALYGQKRGATDLFLSEVYRLSPGSDDFIVNEKVRLPRGTTIFEFSFADWAEAGKTGVVITDSFDHIKLYSDTMEAVYKSDERYGGSEKVLDNDANTTSSGENWYYMPQRILAVTMHPDKPQKLFVVSANSATGRVFERYRRYTSATFKTLAYDGLGLATEWESRKLSGYVSDFGIFDYDQDGSDEIVGTIVIKGMDFFKKKTSTVIALEWEHK